MRLQSLPSRDPHKCQNTLHDPCDPSLSSSLSDAVLGTNCFDQSWALTSRGAFCKYKNEVNNCLSHLTNREERSSLGTLNHLKILEGDEPNSGAGSYSSPIISGMFQNISVPECL